MVLSPEMVDAKEVTDSVGGDPDFTSATAGLSLGPELGGGRGGMVRGERPQ